MADVADLLITGAQKSISESTPDVAKAFTQGTEIALRQEQAQQNRVRIEQQKEQIELNKYKQFSDAVFKMDKIKDPQTQRLYQNNFLPKMVSSLGLELDKGQIQFLSTPENRAKLSFLRGEAEEGRLGPADVKSIMLDPENTFPDMPIPRDIIGEAAQEITEGASKFLGRQAKASPALDFRKETEEQKKKERFDKVVTGASKRVTAAFKPIKDAKDGVRTGRDGLEKLLAQAKAGEPMNETLFNASVRGIAKAFNKGAMTEQDVADFKELQGFAGKGEAFFRKWIAGGVNEKIVKNLIAVTDVTSKILDRRGDETGKQLAKSFKTSGFEGQENVIRERSGLDKELRPTFAPKKKKSEGIPGFPKLTLEAFGGT
jgi:hypothetical protein